MSIFKYMDTETPKKNGYFSNYSIIKENGEIKLMLVDSIAGVHQKFRKYWLLDGDNKSQYKSKIDALRAFNKAVKQKVLNNF